MTNHQTLRAVFTALGLVFCAETGLGFSNQHYSFTSPAGWKEEPKLFGSDVLYVGSFSSEPAPVITLMTLKKEMKEADLGEFLTSSIKSDFEKRNAGAYKIRSQGKPKDMQVPAYFVEYEYPGKNGPMRDHSVIILGKKQYHLLLFSAQTKEFDFYLRDARKITQSFKLQ